MNTHLYKIETIKPKCAQDKTGSIIINDMSMGILSFSWLNLDLHARITDNGRIINNLGCGIYTLKIYDILRRTSDTVSIDLSCADILSIDLLHVDNIKCYDDKINMFVEWSGGTPPYVLQINNEYIPTNDNCYTHTIKPNHQYAVSIKDYNGCRDSKENIIVNAQPIDISVNWEPINKHKGLSENVSCTISGGVPPYKIAWFKQNDEHPMIVNQDSLINILKAGLYKIVVIDSNNCQNFKDFTITEPPPMSANISIFNDYSTKSLFEPHAAQIVYNLMLLPDKLISDQKVLKAKNISIKHGKNIIQQKLCLDYGSITINKQLYRYYYISPGLPALSTHKTTLNIDDKEYSLEHSFGSSSPKLIIGSLLLRNDYSFAYKKNDIVSIKSNNDNINLQINQIYIKNGLYLSNNIYTILNLINTNTLDSDSLFFINQTNTADVFVQSLTTKSNNRLGSVICNVSNGDKNSLKAILINEHNDEEIYYFNNKYTLTIDNLKYGIYKLIIKDAYSTASVYNNIPIDKEYFNITILDSFEKERDAASIQSSQTFNIDPNILNLYNEKPNKLLFFDPQFKNGVLMNISPNDACYKITGENVDLEDCGYKIIDSLQHGKYTIKVFKDNYKTQFIDLFFNTDKDLITVILEKST